MAPSRIPIATCRARVPGGPTYDPTLMRAPQKSTPTKTMSTMAWVQAQEEITRQENGTMIKDSVDEKGTAEDEKATCRQVETIAMEENITSEERVSQVQHARQEKSGKLAEVKNTAPVNNEHTTFPKPIHPNCIACGSEAISPNETSIERELRMLKNEVKHAVGEIYLAISNTKREMMGLEGELDGVWSEFNSEGL